MNLQQRSKLFYRESPKEVVVYHQGREVAVYRNARELIEVHIKGLIATDKLTASQVKDTYHNSPDDNNQANKQT